MRIRTFLWASLGKARVSCNQGRWQSKYGATLLEKSDFSCHAAFGKAAFGGLVVLVNPNFV